MRRRVAVLRVRRLPWEVCHAAADRAAIAGGAREGACVVSRLADKLRGALAENRLAAGEVVPLLVEAIGAFARQDWAAAITAFEAALPQTTRIGGSRAQRDLIRHTLLMACLRDGRSDAAQRLI